MDLAVHSDQILLNDVTYILTWNLVSKNGAKSHKSLAHHTKSTPQSAHKDTHE